MIERFFDKTATVSRMSAGTDGSGNYEQTQAEAGSFSCHIQQAGPELAEHVGLSFTKTYSVWCPVDSDVREGDMLEIASSNYTVRAVQTNDIGANRHRELICEYAGAVS